MESDCHSYAMPSRMPAELRQAFSLLMRGAQYARSTNNDVWDFAVEIHELIRLGLTSNDLRFLVELEYVDHGIERTAAGDTRRRFHCAIGPSFGRRSCFIVTPRGALAAHLFCDATNQRVRGNPIGALLAGTSSLHGSDTPTWDAGRYTLYLGSHIVKRFTWQAANQVRVLAAFQEEGWPVRIDDPLAPSPTVHAKRRLSDTIKCLNRKQQIKLIHFRGDGTGQGITWEPAEAI
jgi:hypothetical protein